MLVTKKFLGPKTFRIQKKIGSKKKAQTGKFLIKKNILAPKSIFGQLFFSYYKFWVEKKNLLKKILVKKFWSKKILVENIFGEKIFCKKKIWWKIMFWSTNIFGQNKFLLEKNFLGEKIVG